MSDKKPIDSLKLFNEEFNGKLARQWGERTITRFSSKTIKKLYQKGYYVETITELWFDDEEGLGFNNWVEEYPWGGWGMMSQKYVLNMAKGIARDFSHLTRRPRQKVLPRCYKQEDDEYIMFYLYMRDRGYCDYAIFFKKKGE